jgi:hypothetical protein
MSGGAFCSCPKGPDRSKNWRIRQYRSNASAFNGYRTTPSDYSALRCTVCRAAWRTKASYVDDLHRQGQMES